MLARAESPRGPLQQTHEAFAASLEPAVMLQGRQAEGRVDKRQSQVSARTLQARVFTQCWPEPPNSSRHMQRRRLG